MLVSRRAARAYIRPDKCRLRVYLCAPLACNRRPIFPFPTSRSVAMLARHPASRRCTICRPKTRPPALLSLAPNRCIFLYSISGWSAQARTRLVTTATVRSGCVRRCVHGVLFPVMPAVRCMVGSCIVLRTRPQSQCGSESYVPVEPRSSASSHDRPTYSHAEPGYPGTFFFWQPR
jgi:hypothetical protein